MRVSIAWVAAAIACVAVQTADAQSSFLRRFADQLSQQVVPAPPADTLPTPRGASAGPNAARPPLGIRVGPVNEEVIREQRLVVSRGAVITAIEKGSAADRAGLPLGAVIVAVNGRRIDTPEDMVQAVQASRAGQDLELTYYDQNKLARKKVHFAGAQAGDPVAVPNPPGVAATPQPGPSLPTPVPQSNLERELNADGSRPLLGRIGRVIDNFAPTTPPAEVPPEPAPPVRGAVESDVLELRQQVAELSKQIEALRKQVTSLEKKLSEQKSR